MTSRRANVASIAVVFTLAFLSYFTDELIPAVQMIPLALFGILTFIQVWCAKPRWAGASLLAGDGSTYVWFIPLLTLGCTLSSRFDKSLSYWVIDSAMLILARLYTVRVPADHVLEGFFWGAVCSLGAFCGVAYQTLVDTVFSVKRLEPFGFHPNTLGFILAGFFAVMVWQVLTAKRWKRLLAVTGAITSFVLMFLASSRGSLLAAAVACAAAGGLYCWREKKMWVPIACVAILAGAFLALYQSSYFDDAVGYTDDVLQISGGDRGLGSGLSGRTDTWKLVITEMAHGSWIYGNGMRASDGMDNPIDNGFLVVIYDMGIIPLLIIVARTGVLLWRFPRRYWALGDKTDLLLSMLMMIFLVNNFVERLLFGVGNPLSLLMFLIVASPWSRPRAIPWFASQPVVASAQ